MAPSHGSQSRRGWTLVIILAAVALGGYFGWRHFTGNGAEIAASDAANKGQPQPTAIPVTIAQAQTADFPVYLNGLGTVEPYDTVTVNSRVDGEIVKIGFRQGQMVKEGDVLAEIDPRPYQAALDQAQAKKAQDEANLKNAQLNLERYNTLAKQDFASRQQLDTQQAMVDQLTAQIKGDQAAVDNAQTQLDYTTIKSPLAGKTGFRLVDPGNIVHASATTGIVTIVKLQPISVVFTAPEEDVPQINKALAAGAVPVTALSSDGLKTLSQGHLALVNNAVDQASGDIRMKATFANEDNVLWPGLSVATRLLVDTLKQVVVVPEGAVERGPNGLYAFVVGDDNKVEIRDIKVSQEGNGQSVVSQGLTAGQKVVTAGQYRLKQGALVEPTDATSSATAQNAAPNAPAKAP
ncbi:efflux RND transporter periplasmic adaptor subunit [Methylocapsa sp. S129]|uniref:efflux RND transporter periplasmic adaptor subunit n=1 Tax=Methylocapsa sp. S129 TaxID=1641869 RepID=UPI001FEFC8B0|nr:efflux RND transporter periplasmic adaptor subunit [Methylocapsa sp. S129]